MQIWGVSFKPTFFQTYHLPALRRVSWHRPIHHPRTGTLMGAQDHVLVHLNLLCYVTQIHPHCHTKYRSIVLCDTKRQRASILPLSME